MSHTPMSQDAFALELMNIAKHDSVFMCAVHAAIQSHGLDINLGHDALRQKMESLFLFNEPLFNYRANAEKFYRVIETATLGYNPDGATHSAAKGAGPYTVQNLVVLFNRYATSHVAAHGEYAMRQRFEGTVFYMPPDVAGADNKKVRDQMKEGRTVYVTTFVPPQDIDMTIAKGEAMVFKSLELSFDMANRAELVDLRSACAVPGTKEEQKRVAHVTWGKATDPCSSCTCTVRKAPGPQY